MENEKEKLEDNKKLEKKHSPLVASKNLIFKKGASGITLIALVITISNIAILSSTESLSFSNSDFPRI